LPVDSIFLDDPNSSI